MALELLAGPFTVTNKLTGAPLSDTVGTPCWIDGRGLILPGSAETIYLVQMDGAAYPIINDRSLIHGLALIGGGANPTGRTRWHALADLFGVGGEWDIDPVTLYKATQFTPDYLLTFGNGYARLHDRYIYPLNGSIESVSLTLTGWNVEKTKPGLTDATSMSWGSAANEIVVGAKSGQIIRYDWVQKEFISSIQTIGMTCLGLWWSALHGVYLSLHDAGSTLELRVWADTVHPTSVSAPVADATPIAGRRTRIRSRVMGGDSDPCEGEVVAWSLTGAGSLSAAASYTDTDGYAETYYEAPIDSEAASISITAEVAV